MSSRRFARAVAALVLLAVPIVSRAEMKPADKPLLLAITSNDVAAVKQAVWAGANPSFVDGDVSPLWLAITMRNEAVIDALLAAGADPTMKDTQGRTAADVADAMNNPTLAAKLRAAKPALTAATAVPSVPAPVAKPAAAIEETGVFDDVHFTAPDPKKWTPNVVDNDLVFSTRLPPPDFCMIKVYSSRDVKGDEAAFNKQFDDLVQASLKATKTMKVEKDSGPTKVPNDKPGFTVTQRVLYCETEDFHVAHFFVALRSGDRMELIAYQSSGLEMFGKNQADAEKFLSSISVETSKSLNP